MTLTHFNEDRPTAHFSGDRRNSQEPGTSHSCDYYKYADDTEISGSAPPSDFTSAQSNIQSCISDTLSWMQSNKLKLNTEKNWDDACRFITAYQFGRLRVCRYRWKFIPFQTTVTYLGVHLDQKPSMKQHISSLCLTTFLALRRIASIRPFLSNSSTEKLVVSMITSRLDYYNATFMCSRWTNRAHTKDPKQQLRVGSNIMICFFV